jgi:hypothetical protein
MVIGETSAGSQIAQRLIQIIDPKLRYRQEIFGLSEKWAYLKGIILQSIQRIED